MDNRLSLNSHHAAAAFIYFLVVIVFTFALTNPIFLTVSLFAALLLSVILRKKAALKFFLFVPLPLMAGVTLLNALFLHKGLTVLFFINSRPVTTESILYGLNSGVKLSAAVMWFYCYNEIITGEKIISLFGKALPKTALMLSLTMSLIPSMSKKIRQISMAQTMIGKGIKTKKLKDRIKNGINILSALISSALENGIETADTMSARGYGAKRRTAFSLYRFNKKDALFLTLSLLLTAALTAAAALNFFPSQFFPLIEIKLSGVKTIVSLALFSLLCFLPLVKEIFWGCKWRYLKSKI